jgi:hypothetical protein
MSPSIVVVSGVRWWGGNTSTAALLQDVIELAAYFSTVVIPMPGMASSSRTVPGRRVAMALNAWSLRIRNAGTPRRLASAKRQARRASSIPESEPTFDRWSSGTGLDQPGVSGLFARFRFAATAPFLLPLRFAGTAVSFMMNSMGVVSFIE